MRRLARSTYALMVSLLPATATVIGVVVLAQVPTVAEIVGVALVIAGVAVHREAGEADTVPSSHGAERHRGAGGRRRLRTG
jgi:threonine/homoserine efflux transporter RhtA